MSAANSRCSPATYVLHLTLLMWFYHLFVKEPNIFQARLIEYDLLRRCRGRSIHDSSRIKLKFCLYCTLAIQDIFDSTGHYRRKKFAILHMIHKLKAHKICFCISFLMLHYTQVCLNLCYQQPLKCSQILPAQARVILFVDIFSLRRTGILHTASFSECTVGGGGLILYCLVLSFFSVFISLYFQI